MEISLTATGKLTGVEHRIMAASNMRPVMQRLADDLRFEIDQSFESSKSPWGGAWAQWRATTRALMERGGLFGAQRTPNLKLLVGTGALRRGFLATATETEAKVVQTGPASKYAAVHQFGNASNRLPNRATFRTGRRKGKPTSPAPIPARPFMPINRGGRMQLPREWRDRILQSLRVHFGGGGGR